MISFCSTGLLNLPLHRNLLSNHRGSHSRDDPITYVMPWQCLRLFASLECVSWNSVSCFSYQDCIVSLKVSSTVGKSHSLADQDLGSQPFGAWDLFRGATFLNWTHLVWIVIALVLVVLILIILIVVWVCRGGWHCS